MPPANADTNTPLRGLLAMRDGVTVTLSHSLVHGRGIMQ
jgi:hypothetical protein